MKNFAKNTLAVFVGMALAAGITWAQSAAQPSLKKFPEPVNQAASRPCVYQSGGWATIDSDNGAGANASAALTLWTTYVIQCDDDAYIAWGGSTVDADTADGWIAGGAWIRFFVAGDNNYVAVQNKTDATADCHYIECK